MLSSIVRRFLGACVLFLAAELRPTGRRDGKGRCVVVADLGHSDP